MSQTQAPQASAPVQIAPKPAPAQPIKIVSPSAPPTAAPAPATSIAAGVNAAVSKNLPVPKGIRAFNTSDLKKEVSFFRGMLYGETDSRKTTTAADFGGPEKTFIIGTRAAEQLLPLQERSFRAALIDDGPALSWALQFPDQAARAFGFPEFAEMLADPTAEPVLVVDDMTEGANFLVDDNSTRDDGSDVKDGRQIYKAVNDNLRDIMASLKRRRMHLVFTALARRYETPLANEEAIGPDMPTGARSIITADLEHVLFMKKSSTTAPNSPGKFVFRSQYLHYKKKDDKGKEQLYKREIFAKYKLPKELNLKQPPVLNISGEEDMNLRSYWNKVKPPKQ